MSDRKFWLVWRPDGYPPSKRHTSKAAAYTESRRLAEANPGKEFFVLEAIQLSKKPEPVSTIELRDYREECPF